jgi:hypothetical protein
MPGSMQKSVTVGEAASAVWAVLVTSSSESSMGPGSGAVEQRGQNSSGGEADRRQ